jgi:hypothetical protein
LYCLDKILLDIILSTSLLIRLRRVLGKDSLAILGPKGLKIFILIAW